EACASGTTGGSSGSSGAFWTASQTASDQASACWISSRGGGPPYAPTATSTASGKARPGTSARPGASAEKGSPQARVSGSGPSWSEPERQRGGSRVPRGTLLPPRWRSGSEVRILGVKIYSEC